MGDSDKQQGIKNYTFSRERGCIRAVILQNEVLVLNATDWKKHDHELLCREKSEFNIESPTLKEMKSPDIFSAIAIIVLCGFLLLQILFCNHFRGFMLFFF